VNKTERSAPVKTTLLPALLLAGCIVGCNGKSPDTPDAPVSSNETTPSATAASDTLTFQAEGVIQNITPSRTYVVIRHETIPGFMDAMSMPFAVADSSLLVDRAIDDSISFTIRVVDSNVTVTEIEN